MSDDSEPVTAAEETSPVEVRTYFVRRRNALVARAEFADLYVDYYLHQGQLAVQHAPFHDGMFKEALAALTLHCASRPRTETTAWTLHFQQPLLNLFVTGDNQRGTVVGQIFTDDVKDLGRNAFFADVAKEGRPLRRSSVEFGGPGAFRAVETYYAQSEQRPARYFVHGAEDFVMISAEPDCDLAWLESLTNESMEGLDQTEQLSLLESRRYRWFCGCSQERMMAALEPVMKSDPAGLFGGEVSIRMRCPRCGRRHLITRESMEAFLAE